MIDSICKQETSYGEAIEHSTNKVILELSGKTAHSMMLKEIMQLTLIVTQSTSVHWSNYKEKVTQAIPMPTSHKAIF